METTEKNTTIWFKIKEILKRFKRNLMNRNMVFDLRPYKVYTALLTQSGTDAPKAIVLENTIGTVTFQYITTGVYWVVLIDAFPRDKTIVLSSNNNTYLRNKTEFYVNTNNIAISTFDNSNLPENNLLQKQSIEIRVYN